MATWWAFSRHALREIFKCNQSLLRTKSSGILNFLSCAQLNVQAFQHVHTSGPFFQELKSLSGRNQQIVLITKAVSKNHVLSE